MGEVYLADDPHIDRKLAIKTVRLGDGGAIEQEERKVRLMREAKAAGRVVHPNVVTLFDAGEAADGVFYLAFEYVAGMDLSQRIREAPALTLGEVIRIVRQAAEGLDAAHRQGIVHRDIKPSNIMLDQHGQVKVSDFGIAKMLGQATELTQTGSVVGSPHYLSPEQIRGEELDGRSDLFSLGVVFYELLTRTRPFEGDTITTLVYQILARDPLPIVGFHPGLEPRLGAVVTRLLAKERDQRFGTARELADELAACERELSRDQLDRPAAPLPDDMQETSMMPASGGVPAVPPVTATGATIHATAPPPMPPPGSRDATEATRLGAGRKTQVVSPGSSAAEAAAASVGAGAAAAATAGNAPPAFPPPPPIPPFGAPGAPAGAPPTPPPSVVPAAGAPAAPAYAARPAAPAKRGFPCAVFVVLGVVALLALAGAVGGWFWWKHRQVQTALAQSGSAVPSASPEANGSSAASMPTTAPATSASPAAATTTAAAPSETPPAAPAPSSAPPPQPSLAPAAPAGPLGAPIRITPVAPRPAATHAPPAAPAPPHAAEPAAPPEEPRHHAAPPPEPPARPAPAHEEPAAPAVPAVAFDRELQTTTRIKFDVTPDDTVVSFKEESDRRFTVIGRVADYDANERKLPAFDLPGPGVYYLRLNANGRQMTFRITAQQGAQATTISQVLIPKR